MTHQLRATKACMMLRPAGVSIVVFKFYFASYSVRFKHLFVKL